MRRLHVRFAAACVLAVAIATFTAGAAFGGGGNGNGNGNGNGYGHDNSQQQSQPQQSQQQQSSSSGGSQSDHHATEGQPQQSQQSSSQQQGVKPSNSTQHWTHTTVGAKPDVSKRYGNGKTAAQIAASRGAPASQPLTGPGNSQPHKTYDCRHKNNKSGGVDVHAIKSYSSSGCAAATEQPATTTTQPQEQTVYVSYCQHEGNRWVYKTTTTEQLAKIVQSEDVIAPSFSYHGHSYSKHWDSEGQSIFSHCKHSGSFAVGQTPTSTPAPAEQGEQHVTICHATGTPDNAGNGYVMISPSASGVYHGHYREHGADIIPPFTYGGQTLSLNWTATGQAIFNNGCRPVAAGAVAGATTTVTTPCTCTQTTTTTVSTTTPTTASPTTTVALAPTTAATTTTTPAGGVAGTTTTVTTVPQVAAVVPAAAPKTASAGGVLGAQTSLAPKPASHGGVLGTVTHVAGSSLPFTGFPVWLAVLIALALILAGFALRRRTLGPRGL